MFPWTLDLGPWTLDLVLDLSPLTLDLGPWTLDTLPDDLAMHGIHAVRTMRLYGLNNNPASL